MAFTFRQLKIPDVLQIESSPWPDSRGYFLEAFKSSEFKANGIDLEFFQDNFSHSVKGVLRGLHFQLPPKAQGKLVMALRGEIFDVAADIRKSSPTFGKWVSAVLSEENHRMLYVPPGFAHGFCVLSGEAEVMYKCTNEYAPQYDRGILWSDPDLAVEWPVKNPILSPKDGMLPTLKQYETLEILESKTSS